MHTQMVDRLLTIQGYTFLETNAYEVYFLTFHIQLRIV